MADARLLFLKGVKTQKVAEIIRKKAAINWAMAKRREIQKMNLKSALKRSCSRKIGQIRLWEKQRES
jgi:hypothetical protein